jgi:hypothetical protein
MERDTFLQFHNILPSPPAKKKNIKGCDVVIRCVCRCVVLCVCSDCVCNWLYCVGCGIV